jgi:hypothetical protein
LDKIQGILSILNQEALRDGWLCYPDSFPSCPILCFDQLKEFFTSVVKPANSLTMKEPVHRNVKPYEIFQAESLVTFSKLMKILAIKLDM